MDGRKALRVGHAFSKSRPRPEDKMSFYCVLGPLHTRAKGHDHEMVRALDYQPKAIPCVLGKPFCVVMGPQTWCKVRMEHVEGPLHMLLVGKDGQLYLTTLNKIFGV